MQKSRGGQFDGGRSTLARRAIRIADLCFKCKTRWSAQGLAGPTSVGWETSGADVMCKSTGKFFTRVWLSQAITYTEIDAEVGLAQPNTASLFVCSG